MQQAGHTREPPDVHALERTVEEQSKRQRAQLVEAGRCYERKATLARQRVALQAERAAKVELLAKRRRASAEGWRHSTAADGGTLLSDADAGGSADCSGSCASSFPTGAPSASEADQGATAAAGPSGSQLSSAPDAAAAEARRPRVVMGVTLPRFLEPLEVLRLISVLHERVCAFADVRLIVGSEISTLDCSMQWAQQVRVASLAPEVASARGRESLFFSEDEYALYPDQLPAALAQWGDVLLIAPLNDTQLKAIAEGGRANLTQAVALFWQADARELPRAPPARRFRTRKPFVVAPRLHRMLRHNHPRIVAYKEQLLSRGVEIVEEPDDDAEPDDPDGEPYMHGEGYVNELLQQVKHAILKAQDGMAAVAGGAGGARRGSCE